MPHKQAAFPTRLPSCTHVALRACAHWVTSVLAVFSITLSHLSYLRPHGTGACFSAPDWTLGSCREGTSWVLELPSPRGGLIPGVRVCIMKPAGGLW